MSSFSTVHCLIYFQRKYRIKNTEVIEIYTWPNNEAARSPEEGGRLAEGQAVRKLFILTDFVPFSRFFNCVNMLTADHSGHAI
jgi:hypothetical protein